MSASYYQAQLDSINAAIAALEAGEAEVRMPNNGGTVRYQDLATLYPERARLERELARVSRPGGRISISRGAAL